MLNKYLRRETVQGLRRRSGNLFDLPDEVQLLAKTRPRDPLMLVATG